MLSAEELAKFIAERIDAEVTGDYDIAARADEGSNTVAVWVEHQTEEEGTTFLITVDPEDV